MLAYKPGRLHILQSNPGYVASYKFTPCIKRHKEDNCNIYNIYKKSNPEAIELSWNKL